MFTVKQISHKCYFQVKMWHCVHTNLNSSFFCFGWQTTILSFTTIILYGEESKQRKYLFFLNNFITRVGYFQILTLWGVKKIHFWLWKSFRLHGIENQNLRQNIVTLSNIAWLLCNLLAALKISWQHMKSRWANDTNLHPRSKTEIHSQYSLPWPLSIPLPLEVQHQCLTDLWEEERRDTVVNSLGFKPSTLISRPFPISERKRALFVRACFLINWWPRYDNLSQDPEELVVLVCNVQDAGTTETQCVCVRAAITNVVGT